MTGTAAASFSKLLFILYKAPLYNSHLPLAYIVNKCTPALGLSSQSSLEKGARPGKLRVSFSGASSTPGSEGIIGPTCGRVQNTLVLNSLALGTVWSFA